MKFVVEAVASWLRLKGSLPIGPIVVPFADYLFGYKFEPPKGNYYGAYGLQKATSPHIPSRKKNPET